MRVQDTLQQAGEGLQDWQILASFCLSPAQAAADDCPPALVKNTT